jgi:hypothetical protein
VREAERTQGVQRRLICTQYSWTTKQPMDSQLTLDRRIAIKDSWPPPPTTARTNTSGCSTPTTSSYPEPVGERSHTVHAYCVNTLAWKVFTRVNTPSWQVFTHLPVDPKKSLCGTRLADAAGFPDSRSVNSFSLILIGRGLVCLLEHIRNAEEDVLLQGEGM